MYECTKFSFDNVFNHEFCSRIRISVNKNMIHIFLYLLYLPVDNTLCEPYIKISIGYFFGNLCLLRNKTSIRYILLSFLIPYRIL